MTKLISRVFVPACNPNSNGEVFLFLYILASICCHLRFWSQPFWLVWGGISGLFWFAFPWWLMVLNISFGASQSFSIPQLRILCLALYPIFLIFISCVTPSGYMGFSTVLYLESTELQMLPNTLQSFGISKLFPLCPEFILIFLYFHIHEI
jgi:hypothetical protein